MDNLERSPWDHGPFCREIRKNFVVEVREFSSTIVYGPGISSNMVEEVRMLASDESDERRHRQNDDNDRDSHYACNVEVYPNGCDSSTEGHVCLKFRLCSWSHRYCHMEKRAVGHVEMKCVIAVVDAEGCGRFPQTFAFTQDETEKTTEYIDIPFQNYISRDFLLTDKNHLLPGDTLTVRGEMFLNMYYTGQGCGHLFFIDLLQASFEIKNIMSTDNQFLRLGQECLRLKSPVAELLREESLYFRRMCSTSMVEKNAGYVEIPREESRTFRQMLQILYYPKTDGIELEFEFLEILEVYAMADFYGIESVLDTCRCWLSLVCRTPEVDASEISTLADTYGDSILGEIAAGALATNSDGSEVPGSFAYGPWAVDTDFAIPYRLSFHFYMPPKTGNENEGNRNVTEDFGDISNCYI